MSKDMNIIPVLVILGFESGRPPKILPKCLSLLCFVLPRYAKEHSKLSVTYCLVVMDVFLCFFGCILSIFIFFCMMYVAIAPLAMRSLIKGDPCPKCNF